MEKAPSLDPKGDIAPLDMSDLSNYTSQQLIDMAKAGASQGAQGKVYGGFGRDNVSNDSKMAASMHADYENKLQGFYQDFRGANVSSQGTQGHASPFDTALDRYSPNVAQRINF